MNESNNPFQSPEVSYDDEANPNRLTTKDYVRLATMTCIVALLAGIEFALFETPFVAVYGTVVLFIVLTIYAIVAGNRGRHSNFTKAIIVGTVLGIVATIGSYILFCMMCFTGVEAAGFQFLVEGQNHTRTQYLIGGLSVFACAVIVAAINFFGVYSVTQAFSLAKEKVLWIDENNDDEQTS